MIGLPQFISYMLVPLSVGMFPHLFQHWLTAKSAKTFRLTVIAHPIFIMIVWVPCILIGIWAVGAGIAAPGGNSNAVLGRMVGDLLENPLLTGMLTAGILAAIMSSLDSQFLCIGTMFTNDIAVRLFGADRFSDRQKLWLGRAFVVAIVTITYIISLVSTRHIFDLAVWCFSGFGALFPNYETENIAEIPTSFGGLLFMMAAVTYLAGVVLLEAWPVYLYLDSRFQAGTAEVSPVPLMMGVAGAIALTIAATLLPLRAGISKVQSVDF